MGKKFQKAKKHCLSLAALCRVPFEVLQRPDVHSQGAAPEGLPVPAGRSPGPGTAAALQGPAAQPGAGEQAGGGLDHTQPGGKRGSLGVTETTRCRHVYNLVLYIFILSLFLLPLPPPFSPFLPLLPLSSSFSRLSGLARPLRAPVLGVPPP